MKAHLHSENFLNSHRTSPNAFLRERVLSFPVMFSFIFNLLRKSIPKEQIAFCKNCNVSRTSRPAITKARRKLSPKAFIEMNHILLKEFYTDNPVKKFHGFITLAVDGSTVQLPIGSTEILQKYRGATNGNCSEVPMARISTLFDVVNGITWDAIIAPYDSNERKMAIQHFKELKSLVEEPLLIIFDRGYPSLALIVYLLENGIDFLMRTSSQFFKEIQEVVKTGKRDTIIQIPLKRASRAAKAELKELFPEINFNKIISIRVVVVTLSTGENEVLITSLLDEKKYPYKIFRELYFKRWGTEENYKFFKVCLEIENFSGKSCIAVEQDFHATVLAANSRALLAYEAMHEINCRERIPLNSNPKKYVYEINKNISMEALKHEFVNALLHPEISLEHFCKEVKSIMKQYLIPIRPERNFHRERKHPGRKHHMNLR